MSFYMKFNGWAGDDINGATASLAKMFRMDSGKATQAMHRITEGQNWQFQWPISHKQAKAARSYMRWLGFDLELNPTKHSFRSQSIPTKFSSGAQVAKVVFLNPLNQLVELTGNISNAFTIALYKVDNTNQIMTLRHYISLSSNFNCEKKIKFGEGPMGAIAENKKRILIQNIDKNPIKLCFYKKKENLKSFFAMPVVYKKLKGILAIDSKQSYVFSEKQQKIILGLADQMAWHLYQEKFSHKLPTRQ